MQSVSRQFVAPSFAALAFGGCTAASAAQPAVTRAELRADLHIYREPGLYWLEAAEISPLAPEYKRARQR